MEALNLIYIPLPPKRPPLFYPYRKNSLFFQPHLNLNLKLSTVRVSNYNSKNLTANSVSPRVADELHPGTSQESRVPDKSRTADELRKETEEILEWHSVCSQVSAFASTAAGRARCRSAELQIGRSQEESDKLLEQTKGAVLLSNPLDFSGVEDVEEFVSSAVRGELLTIQQLCVVKRSILAIKRIFEQLERISSDGESTDR